MLALAASASAGVFDDDAVLDVVLSGPLSSVIADKRDREEQPFSLTIDGDTYDVAVRIRGNSRVVACPFPPLRLNFKTSELDGTVLEGEDKLKLVTHCRDGSEQAEDSLLNEFAAYRAFNEISLYAYRVRLLRIRYDDTEKESDEDSEPRYGFLIESDSGLARRLGGEVVETPGVVFSNLDALHTARLSIFQYLIGNTDWSFVSAENDDECCHNIDLLRVDGNLVAVPYDFDLAAMTRARYRRGAQLNQSKRREYVGYCRTDQDALTRSLEEIVAAKEAIVAAVSDVPAVSPRSHGRRVDFTEEFFEEASDDRRLLASFDKSCIGLR